MSKPHAAWSPDTGQACISGQLHDSIQVPPHLVEVSVLWAEDLGADPKRWMRQKGAGMASKVRKDFKETQKVVKDAATALRKAADRASKVAKTTGNQISRSKEVKDARKEAQLALKAISAVAKVAWEAAAAGAKSLGDSKEVKRAKAKTSTAAKSTVKTARKATSTASKTAAKSARSKASAAKKKVTSAKKK